MGSAEKQILQDLFGLEGQVAAVVGGAGRIGRVLAASLAAAGAKLAILDIDLEQAEAVADAIRRQTGQGVVALRTDTTQQPQIDSAIDRITGELGSPTILVNAAQFRGEGFYSSDVNEYPKDAWDRVLDVDLTGVHLACQAFSRAMKTAGGGSIVTIASTYGVVAPDPRIYAASGVNSPVAYAAAKAGVIQLTRYLAVHLREDNIRVNCLVPGGVYDGQDETFVAQYQQRTPLGRMARPEDYRAPLLLMVAPGASYMTGAVVTVDGGWTTW